MKKKNIVFIGAGKMATAIAIGLLKKCNADFSALDKSRSSAESFQKTTSVAVHVSEIFDEKANEMLSVADTVIIAVKPQNVSEISSVRDILKDKLVLSIVAGITLDSLNSITASEKIIRVMPNTPALAGVAVSAYCVSEGVTAEDKYFAEKLLESFGSCFAVEEKLMDAVTGLSGSGPAYVFDFIQGLVDGAVREGLPRDKAIVMAAQTVFGAAKMLIDAGEHPAVLKDSVTSPAGTTAEALAVLEKGAFRGLVAEAVKAATERSRQLGRK